MAYHEYERLRDALREELALWKPSEQDFQTSLTKAKANAGLSDIRLSAIQKKALLEIYHEAQAEEWRAKDAAEVPPSAEAVAAMVVAIQDYIRSHPTATFANLAKSVPGFAGEFAMMHGEHDNLILWPSVSSLGIEALNRLLTTGAARIAGASQLSYAMDGLRPTLPVATKVRAYQKPHWLPVYFSIREDAPARKPRRSR